MGIGERKEVIDRWKIDEQCRHSGPWAKEEMAEPDPGRAARTAQVDICSRVLSLKKELPPINLFGKLSLQPPSFIQFVFHKLKL
jgi:hypothetical protein